MSLVHQLIGIWYRDSCRLLRLSQASIALANGNLIIFGGFITVKYVRDSSTKADLVGPRKHQSVTMSTSGAGGSAGRRGYNWRWPGRAE
ncbi:hypothetical protein BYT27DRAFT_7188909 [Phlegmacium glaucopus]|nr:hypothetical protein BYT27DRAFT_7188909 [Phlegmacium glaucopus]